MTEVVAFDDVKDLKRIRTDRPDGHFYTTQFIYHSGERHGAPNVFMIESSQNRVLDTHFHDVDQFQIVVGGGGSLGRHKLTPYSIHFARAFTPYGPLVSGPGAGVSYVTLRARQCPTGGAQRLPEFRAKLDNMPGRHPWQVTGIPDFVPSGVNGIGMAAVPGLTDDRGLAGYALTMKPGTTVTAPAAGPDGQVVVVLKGGLIHEGGEKKGVTVVYVSPEDGPFTVAAGSEGLQALILNFPQPIEMVQPASLAAGTAHDKLWQCELCSFAYDEAAGLPEEGIAPGTRWEDVPEDWVCPDCSAPKADFTLVDL